MFHYNTIKYTTEGEFKDKGSRFISYAFPFQNEEQLKSHLKALRNIHTKARHFCYAYKIGNDSNNFRTYDDGEPGGSAGKPIFNAILSQNLSNVLVIVARYFGGTLLGVPGLINEYKTAATLALKEAEIETIYLKDIWILNFSFENLNDLMKITKEYNLAIIKQEYHPTCSFEIEINKNETTEILAKFKKLRAFEITLKV